MSWIILIILIVLAVVAVSLYNRILTLENRFENAWSQIDVQLKKRNDLIPNLVETVKGYASHEKEVFDRVAKSREKMLQAGNVPERAEAANEMTSALRSVFAIAENYPDLKASENFRVLQEELSAIESKIAYARQFYNDAVLQYNNAIETFPGVLVASLLNKREQVYLEIPETERQAPQVSFS
ncbi:MAG: LemA family protein [Trueperaceae bacterium]|nr:LemA family protein [Trueperaceae bacterium]